MSNERATMLIAGSLVLVALGFAMWRELDWRLREHHRRRRHRRRGGTLV